MEIIIKKTQDNYIAIFNQPTFPLIKKCIIKKTWDKDYIEEFQTKEYDLYYNQLELFDRSYNLFQITLPLDEPLTLYEFYIIKLIDAFNNEYEYFIDYNQFNNIKLDETLFKFKVNHHFADLSKMIRYTFYVQGNFGDVYKAKLGLVLNENEILMRVPNKKTMLSPYYNLLIYSNNKLIDKVGVKILTKDTIDFVFNIEEFGTYLKYTLNPKYNYPQLIDLNIYYKEKILYKSSNEFRNIVFYLPKNSISTTNDITINYTLTEDTIDSRIIKQSVIYNISPYKDSEINLYDFDYSYDFSCDSMEIIWKNNNKKNHKYKITISNNAYYTEETKLLIEKFIELNNNQASLPVKIEVDYNSNYSKEFNFEIPNYHKIDSPKKFIPQIDYSDCLYCNKPYGKLKWTVPNHEYLTKIKIEVLHIKAFLDEYISPWITDNVLDKTVEEFDEKYIDYNQLYDYDFPINNIKRNKTVYDTLISYDGTLQESIFLGKASSYNLPLWYCAKEQKYNITIEIYDRWMNLLGKNSISFPIYDNQVGEVTDDWLWFNRNQEIMFGETGTVGDYFKVTNPTPVEVMKHYSSLYKEYKGKAMYNLYNTDKDNNSLYYFFNKNEGTFLEIKYKRIYNFYKLEY